MGAGCQGQERSLTLADLLKNLRASASFLPPAPGPWHPAPIPAPTSRRALEEIHDEPEIAHLAIAQILRNGRQK